MMSLRRGVTLVELLVTLAILGILASVTTTAARRIERPDPLAPATVLSDSVTAAIAQARVITIALPVGGKIVYAVALPSGAVVADSAFDVDAFTGRRNAR
ncbi:MAG TPA: prepilin-type N-terminal cleavage/methylation domain-containing protein [Gemmatimonadaceae bacterium]|nr:prepilin-type N-terminal cleavage/methylation domain-containing protein [Gemmatimonadaceae bacterium]